MASFLVLYGSGQGQTAKVAAYVNDVLADRGHDVPMRHVTNTSDGRVTDFDAVVVGSPINNGAHLPEVVDFIEANREALTTRPGPFFQLSLTFMIPFGAAQDAEREWASERCLCLRW